METTSGYGLKNETLECTLLQIVPGFLLFGHDRIGAVITQHFIIKGSSGNRVGDFGAF
jgi:hypothetical protein